MFNCDMKKIFAIILCFFCCFFAIGVNTAAAESVQYVVVANSATVFATAEFSDQKIATLTHGQEVVLELEGEEPKQYSSGGYVFFKVLELDGQSGFVLGDLVCKKTDQITAIPNFNAQTNGKCTVFFKNDDKFVDSGITLEKAHRIFLQNGYDKNSQYCQIVFVHENEVIYGYIQTKFVKPDGINPVLITCITLIIALLTIIFTWLFMKNKKKKWKKSGKNSHITVKLKEE